MNNLIVSYNRFKTLFPLYLVIIALFYSFLSLAKTDSLDELRAMSQKSLFDDFFKTINHTPPSKRNATWSELVQSTYAKYLESLGDFLNDQELESLIKLNSKNIFRKDQKNLYLSNKKILNNFDLRLKASETNENAKEIFKKILNFWSKNNKLPEINYQIINKIESSPFFLSNIKLLSPIIDTSLKSNLAELTCSKKSIQEYISKKVFLVSENFDLNNQDFALKNFDISLSKKISRKCWEQTINYFKSILENPKTSISKSKQIIKTINMDIGISKFNKTYMNILFLLRAPGNSKELNVAYTSLKKLQKKYFLREKISAKIQNLEIIPDNIFNESYLNISLKKKLISFFPEIKNSYEKRCLDYLKGKSNDKLNPTLYCKDFYKLIKTNQRSELSKFFNHLENKTRI